MLSMVCFAYTTKYYSDCLFYKHFNLKLNYILFRVSDIRDIVLVSLFEVFLAALRIWFNCIGICFWIPVCWAY